MTLGSASRRKSIFGSFQKTSRAAPARTPLPSASISAEFVDGRAARNFDEDTLGPERFEDARADDISRRFAAGDGDDEDVRDGG